jgi:hypothetical protein
MMGEDSFSDISAPYRPSVEELTNLKEHAQGKGNFIKLMVERTDNLRHL